MPNPPPNSKRMVKTGTVGAGRANKAHEVQSLTPEQALKSLPATGGDVQPFKRMMNVLKLPEKMTVVNAKKFQSPEALLMEGFRYFMRCGENDMPPTWCGLSAFLGISSRTMGRYLNGQDEDYSEAAMRLRDVVVTWAETSLYGPSAKGATAHLGYLSSFVQERLSLDDDKFNIVFDEVNSRWNADDAR